MNSVILFFFILISAMYLYGYYTYYLKERKRLPKCNVIYILDDEIKDDHKPDFNDTRKRSNRNVTQKTEVRENVKKKIIELINEKGKNISNDLEFDKVIDLANNLGINDQEINRIFHEESLKIRGKRY